MEPAAAVTPSTPPSKKRRRRWPIVALLLAMVGVAWWNWPRIDPRFVGKWTVSTDEPGNLFGPLVLAADGTGEIVIGQLSGRNMTTRVYRFPWRVEGRTLAVLCEPQSSVPYFKRALEFAHRRTKSPIFLGRERFSIASPVEKITQLTRRTSLTPKSFLPATFSITRIPE